MTKKLSQIKALIAAFTFGAVLIMVSCTSDKTNYTDTASVQNNKTAMQIDYVDAKGAYALLASSSEMAVLDIRTPKEIEDGFINGAVFADFKEDDFEIKLAKLDRNTHYIVHCKGGGRSTKALDSLNNLGFKHITHMDGGLDDWKRSSLPLTIP